MKVERRKWREVEIEDREKKFVVRIVFYNFI